MPGLRLISFANQIFFNCGSSGSLQETAKDTKEIMVGSRRIELRTRGFSGLCSTD